MSVTGRQSVVVLKIALRTSYTVLAVCTVAHFMHHVYTGALSPMLPLIRMDMNLTLTESGIIASAAVTSMTVSHLLVGSLSDRGLGKTLIPSSVLLTGMMLWTTAYSTTFWFILCVQIVLGIGAATYHPCAFPVLAEQFPSQRRAFATGVQGMGGIIGSALVPALGVFLLVWLGSWQGAFITLGGIGIVLFVPLLLAMKRGTDQCVMENNTNLGKRQVEGWTRDFALLVILSGLRGIPFRCMTLLMPLYLASSRGMDPSLAGILTSVMLASGILAEFISGPLSDRVQKRVPFIVMSSAFMIPTLLLLNLELDLVMLTLVLIATGFWFYWGDPPGMALETELSPAHRRGLAFGLIFSVGAVPGALAPALFGYIGDTFGLNISILFVAGVTAASAIVTSLVRESWREEGGIEVRAGPEPVRPPDQ
ncbi:MAG: MFS transporter [Candidatus Thorarchaeota archaeon]